MADTEEHGSQDARMEAAQIGWVDLPDFKGNPDKWVDAETFLERGRTVMPILRKNNEKLQSELNALREKTVGLETALTSSQESMEALKKFYSEDVQRRVAEMKGELVGKIKQAREDGDVTAELEAGEELQELRDTEREMKARSEEAPAAKTAKEPPALQPWFKAWQEKNPWYGTDEVRSSLAMGISRQLRKEGSELMNEAFLNEVASRVEKYLGGQQSRSADKVEGARNGSGGGAGRSYSDLPADAKAACERQAANLVGENKAFKTVAEWRKHYTLLYYGEQS